MADTVITTTAERVRTIALDRPERLNAINRALIDDLCAALAEAHRDPAVGAIVLRGAGRAFCSARASA